MVSMPCFCWRWRQVANPPSLAANARSESATHLVHKDLSVTHPTVNPSSEAPAALDDTCGTPLNQNADLRQSASHQQLPSLLSSANERLPQPGASSPPQPLEPSEVPSTIPAERPLALQPSQEVLNSTATAAATAAAAAAAAAATFTQLRSLQPLHGELTQLSWLGSGSGGRVYAGLWRGSPVAVKILVSSTPDEVRDSLREALLNRVASHPHMVQCFAAFSGHVTDEDMAPRLALHTQQQLQQQRQQQLAGPGRHPPGARSHPPPLAPPQQASEPPGPRTPASLRVQAEQGQGQAEGRPSGSGLGAQGHGSRPPLRSALQEGPWFPCMSSLSSSPASTPPRSAPASEAPMRVAAEGSAGPGTEAEPLAVGAGAGVGAGEGPEVGGHRSCSGGGGGGPQFGGPACASAVGVLRPQPYWPAAEALSASDTAARAFIGQGARTFPERHLQRRQQLLQQQQQPHPQNPQQQLNGQADGRSCHNQDHTTTDTSPFVAAAAAAAAAAAGAAARGTGAEVGADWDLAECQRLDGLGQQQQRRRRRRSLGGGSSQQEFEGPLQRPQQQQPHLGVPQPLLLPQQRDEEALHGKPAEDRGAQHLPHQPLHPHPRLHPYRGSCEQLPGPGQDPLDSPPMALLTRDVHGGTLADRGTGVPTTAGSAAAGATAAAAAPGLTGQASHKEEPPSLLPSPPGGGEGELLPSSVSVNCSGPASFSEPAGVGEGGSEGSRAPASGLAQASPASRPMIGSSEAVTPGRCTRIGIGSASAPLIALDGSGGGGGARGGGGGGGGGANVSGFLARSSGGGSMLDKRSLSLMNLGGGGGGGGGMGGLLRPTSRTTLTLSDLMGSAVLDEQSVTPHSELWEVLTATGARPGRHCTMVIMEMCDQGTLQQLTQRQPFSAVRTAERASDLLALLRTALEVAQGMCHLHSLDIVHGDLKPSNVLLQSIANVPLRSGGSRAWEQDGRGYTAKVADFGLAALQPATPAMGLNEAPNNLEIHRAQHTAELGASASERRWGSLPYMAPEVPELGPTKKSDVWSYGMLLYYMCCGKPPYASYGKLRAVQLLLGITQGTLELEWPEETYRLLRRLAETCCQREASSRPPFSRIVPALQRLLRHVAEHPEPASAPRRDRNRGGGGGGGGAGGGGGVGTGASTTGTVSLSAVGSISLSCLDASGEVRTGDGGGGGGNQHSGGQAGQAPAAGPTVGAPAAVGPAAGPQPQGEWGQQRRLRLLPARKARPASLAASTAPEGACSAEAAAAGVPVPMVLALPHVLTYSHCLVLQPGDGAGAHASKLAAGGGAVIGGGTEGMLAAAAAEPRQPLPYGPPAPLSSPWNGSSACATESSYAADRSSYTYTRSNATVLMDCSQVVLKLARGSASTIHH